MRFTYSTMRFGKKERSVTIYHLRKPIMKGLVGLGGMVESSLFSQRISLCIDHRSECETNYFYMCLAHNPDSGRAEVWMEEPAFYGIKRGDPMARTALFHELGHQYYSHRLKTAEEVDAYDCARVTLTDDGQVKPEELGADQFAVDYLGRDYVIKGLSDLKAALAARVSADDDEKFKETALKELDLRIAKLKAQ